MYNLTKRKPKPSNTIGDNLSKIRKSQGIKQDKLAKMLGISKSTVSLFETGKRLPVTSMLENMAQVLGVSIDKLIGSENLPLQKPEQISHTNLVGPDDLKRYQEVLEKVRVFLPEGGGGPLSEVLEACGEMIVKLERQSERIAELQDKLNYVVELIQGITKEKDD